MTLAFAPEAVREIDDAYEYHERERPGHGELLVDELERVVARAQRFPRSGPIVLGLESHDARSFGLSGFPYTVVTARVAGARTVVAFAHERREPGYWRDRLR